MNSVKPEKFTWQTLMSVAQMGRWGPGRDETWPSGHCLGIGHGNVSSFLLALRDESGQGPWRAIAFVSHKAHGPAKFLERPEVTNSKSMVYTVGEKWIHSCQTGLGIFQS